MRGFLKAVVIAGVTAAASWLVTRWLEACRTASDRASLEVEHWENEGGALAPHEGSIGAWQASR